MTGKITYEEVEAFKAVEKVEIVKLDGKVVGSIYSERAHPQDANVLYYYQPRGSKTHSDKYHSLEYLKRFEIEGGS